MSVRTSPRGAAAPPDSATAADTAPLEYQSGFGNEFATEALAGALARRTEFAAARRAYGLYAEQLSGTAFTAPRAATVARGCTAFALPPCTSRFAGSIRRRIVSRFDEVPTPPNQLRWDPLPMPRCAPPTSSTGW